MGRFPEITVVGMVVEIHQARLKGTGKRVFVAVFLYCFHFNKSFIVSKLCEISRSDKVWFSLCMYMSGKHCYWLGRGTVDASGKASDEVGHETDIGSSWRFGIGERACSRIGWRTERAADDVCTAVAESSISKYESTTVSESTTTTESAGESTGRRSRAAARCGARKFDARRCFHTARRFWRLGCTDIEYSGDGGRQSFYFAGRLG